jgi:hypothetical protein
MASPGNILEVMKGIKLGSTFKDSERNAFVQLLLKDIRGQIENTLPVIYLVRPREIVENQLNGILNLNSTNDPKLAEKYISHIELSDGTELKPGEQNFNLEFHKKITNLQNSSNMSMFTQRLLEALRTAVGVKKIDINTLGNKASELVQILENAQSSINVVFSLGQPQDIAELQGAVSNDIERLGRTFKEWLRANTPAEFIDVSSFLNNFNVKEELLFLGGTFKSARGGIVNETCQKYFIEELKSKGVHALPTFGIGAFTAAGHTGAVSRDGNTGILQEGEILGINTPLKQEIQFLAELNGKSLTDKHLAPFILDTDHAKLSLDFKKEVNPAIKSLLKLNFSFVITQEQAANMILGQVEKSSGNRIALQVLGRAKKAAEEEFKKALLQESIKSGMIVRNSPNVLELLGILLANTVRTGKTKARPADTAKLSKDAIKSNKLTSGRLVKGAKKGSKGTIPKSQKNTNTIPMRNMGDTTIAPINSVSLMNLINTHLQNVVSANMGDGNSKTVLNYRTGRLAGSAKVENLSYSKEGMITAFYSYMKNPYATFSAGGKQSKPVSRDPKLLIGKSIREIAQTIVSNKLRAVAI